MQVRFGRFGKFLGCSGYPECKTVRPLVRPVPTGIQCPDCDEGEIMEKRSRSGKTFFSLQPLPALPLRHLGSAGRRALSAVRRAVRRREDDQARRHGAPLPERGLHVQGDGGGARGGRVSAPLTVIGGGLAGCEAAWLAAQAGCAVRLYEMRPVRGTAAHQTDQLAELVCSNSFRNALARDGGRPAEGGDAPARLAGDARRRRARGAGGRGAGGRPRALRRRGHRRRSRRIRASRVVREEVTAIPDGVAIVATGPLTSPALSRRAAARARPAAPLLLRRHRADRHRRLDRPCDRVRRPRATTRAATTTSTVRSTARSTTPSSTRCSRPRRCRRATSSAASTSRAACRSRRWRGAGRDTLAFGPMRPVGLIDPRTGRRPFAVVQLRQDDAAATLYNMVGFQTKMTYPEQRRVLPHDPRARAAPSSCASAACTATPSSTRRRVLRPTLQLRATPSAVPRRAARSASRATSSRRRAASSPASTRRACSTARPLLVPPPTTALGSLLAYVTDAARRDFQPMNANYGLFPPLASRARGRARRGELGARAARDAAAWMAEHGLAAPRGRVRVRRRLTAVAGRVSRSPAAVAASTAAQPSDQAPAVRRPTLDADDPLPLAALR